MPVNPDIGIRLQRIEHTLNPILELMEVIIHAESRGGFGLLRNLIEELLIHDLNGSFDKAALFFLSAHVSTPVLRS
jgi:hypothetical protein